MNQVLSQEKLTVEAIGKFGIKCGETWYGTNEPLKPTDFVKGSEYTVAVSVSGTGKKYIKEILGAGAVASAPSQSAPTTVAPQTVSVSKPAYKRPFTPYAKKADNGLSKEEWAAKDRNQMIGGRSHDAVELVKAHVNSGKPMEEILTLYREALVGVLKIADETK